MHGDRLGDFQLPALQPKDYTEQFFSNTLTTHNQDANYWFWFYIWLACKVAQVIIIIIIIII